MIVWRYICAQCKTELKKESLHFFFTSPSVFHAMRIVPLSSNYWKRPSMIWRILEITEEGVIDRGGWITPSDICSLQIIDDGDGSENVTLKMNSRFFNFSAFIPIRLKCKMQANFPGVDIMRTALKFRTRKKNSSPLVHVLHKTWV